MTNEDFGRTVWRMTERGVSTRYVRDAILSGLRNGLPPCESELAFIERSEAGTSNETGVRFAAQARKLIEHNKAQAMLQTGKGGDK